MKRIILKFWRFFGSLEEQRRIYILSLVVGIVCGVAALTLKTFVHFVGEELIGHLKENGEGYWYLAFPFVGIAITVVFIRYFVKDDLGHGVSQVLSSISLKKGKLKLHHTFTSMITSAFTIGFGGSVGAEAPVVLTGSAIGSNLSRFFRLNSSQTMLLLACGATGAIAGIFKAPIAGIVFTLEVLMLDLTMASLLPLLISGIAASVVAHVFTGSDMMFHFDHMDNFSTHNIIYYIVLGIFLGLISFYFTRCTFYLERKFKKINKFYVKVMIGGAILAVCIFLFPPLWGEGYSSINHIFANNGDYLLHNTLFFDYADNQWVLISFLFVMLFVKVLAMTATTASGGVGGIFAPSLFVGAIGGYFVALVLNATLDLQLPTANFALAGMGAMIAGVMHAPLLGIFLTAEITGGYQLFMPLMISSITSYITIMAFEPYSIYTKTLAQQGILVTHHKDKAVLHYMSVLPLIETNFAPVSPDASLRDLTKVISGSKRNLYPVVDDEGMMRGMIKLDDVRELIFNQELYDRVYVKDIMYMPEFYVSPKDSMLKVAEIFEACGRFNLAVLEDGKYLGFISRARVFSKYRKDMSLTSNE
ncbi:MAG: chloride channel protein [Mangrovibacterium sp.]